MSIYKDVDDNIYDDMDGAALLLSSWPVGLIEIPDEEAEAILNPPPTLTEQIATLKTAHYAALGELVHDLGDTGIIQVRPQESGALDEPNIRNAIEQMTRNGISEREWKMADDTLALLTVADLQAALESGQDQATVQWDAHITELKILLGV